MEHWLGKQYGPAISTAQTPTRSAPKPPLRRDPGTRSIPSRRRRRGTRHRHRTRRRQRDGMRRAHPHRPRPADPHRLAKGPTPTTAAQSPHRKHDPPDTRHTPLNHPHPLRISTTEGNVTASQGGAKVLGTVGPIYLTLPAENATKNSAVVAARPKRRQNYIPGYASPRRAKGRRAHSSVAVIARDRRDSRLLTPETTGPL